MAKGLRKQATLILILSLLFSRTARSAPAASIDMKVLVLASTGNEGSLGAVRETLDFLGISYDVWIAAQIAGTLSADRLVAGTRALYQCVIVTTPQAGSFNPTTAVWTSYLTAADWSTLSAFETAFGIRQLNWFSAPEGANGFQLSGPATPTARAPVVTHLTTAGSSALPSLPANAAITIQGAICYLSPALADGATTPLLTDDAGNALAVVHQGANGRLALSLTFDSIATSLHSLTLGYSLIHWVTQGMFVGERHVYQSCQLDDLFLANTVFNSTSTVRITGADLDAVAAWQQNMQARPLGAAYRLSLAFNGWGTVPASKFPPAPDTLLESALRNKDQFFWINHTWDHTTLDTVSYEQTRNEITLNNTFAGNQALPGYDPASVVTPGVSGLTNPNCMQAFADLGIRYCVSDTSYAQYRNPTPNTGLANPLQPSVLMVPRHPTNIGFNVSLPAELVDEYNSMYRAYWGRDLTYEEVIDKESSALLIYLLRGDIDPLMFHQENLRSYDGTHGILTDLVDATYAKYSQLANMPIVSLSLTQLGQRMQARMDRNAAGVTASYTRGASPTITLTATKAAVVPVTGLITTAIEGVVIEHYGNQTIAWVQLAAGQSVTLPLQGPGATSNSLSSWFASNTAESCRYQFTFSDGPWDVLRTYIDTDRQAATGCVIGGIGADYMVQNQTLYRWSGDWRPVKSVPQNLAERLVSWTVARADLGLEAFPSAADLVFQAARTLGQTATSPRYTHVFSTGTGAITEYFAKNDDTTLTFQATFSQGFAFHHVFLDTDNSSATGFAIGGVGAEFLIEEDRVYSHAGPGWAWSFVGTATHTASGAVHTWHVTRALVNETGSQAFTNGAVFHAYGGAPETIAPDYHFDFSTPAESTPPPPPPPSTLTSWYAYNDATTCHYSVTSPSGAATTYRVYIDTDKSSTTGFGVGGLGAEYKVENNSLYRWGGSWSLVKPVIQAVAGSTSNWTVDREALGQTATPCANDLFFEAVTGTQTANSAKYTHVYSAGGSLSSYFAWSDSANLHYQADFNTSCTFHHVFIDADNAATGFSIAGIGADYMIEEGRLYHHVGPGWNWALVGNITQTVSGVTYQWTVPRSALSSPALAVSGALFHGSATPDAYGERYQYQVSE